MNKKTHSRPNQHQSQAWRPKVIRGPSYWTLVLASSGIACITFSYLCDRISLELHLYSCVPLYFLNAMCVHDAIHKSAHKTRLFNGLTGWIGSLSFGMTYPIIRRTHLKHHSSVGGVGDHEAFIYSHSWTLPLRLLAVNWRCYGVYRELTATEKSQAVCLLVVIGGALFWAPDVILLAWLIPMQLGMSIFALVTVYLPHGRLSSVVTKWMPGVTGFHEFHHMMPKFAWYQYFTFKITDPKCKESARPTS